MKDYFAILGIKKNATEDDIRNAYRSLAKQFHPDVNKARNAHEKFIEISEAYEFLIQKQSWKTVETEPEKPDYDYDELIREIRERAQRQARMRYEEFKKQHEAFQKSGLNDIALFFNIILRIILLPLLVFLFLFPVFLAFIDWRSIFLSFLFWPFAIIIFFHIKEKRTNYFNPGTLYYTPRRILEIFTQTNPTDELCYFSPNKLADSRPYRIELLKLKNLKLKSRGFRQHQAQYINDKAIILVPRSGKALKVHATIIAIKVLSILGCFIFLGISSFVWRLIFGFALGGVLSILLSLITSTKSSNTYLYNFSFILRITVWIIAISAVSFFSLSPFNIQTSGSIQFVVSIIILTDCFLMQILDLLLRKNTMKTISKLYPPLQQKFDEGYKVYNDVPVISVIFPLYKWVFG